jgi:hypothetical protein
MKVMMDFMKTMLLMPRPWVAWVGLLMTANFVFPLIFITTLEGQIVLGTGMVSAMIQMGIFQTKGFVRLLGIGHSPWIPLLLWLWTRLNFDSSLFAYWILALMVLNSLSLLIDALDVIRYLKGEKEPQLSLASDQ